MIGRHCSRCSNPYIDNPDCACSCHVVERAERLSIFAKAANKQAETLQERGHRRHDQKSGRNVL